MPNYRHRTNNRNQQLMVASLFVAFIVCLFQFNILIFNQSDRWLHVLVSASLGLGMYLLAPVKGRRWVALITAVLFIGLLKEAHDPVFDGLDMLANTVGLLLGLSVLAMGSLLKRR